LSLFEAKRNVVAANNLEELIRLNIVRLEDHEAKLKTQRNARIVDVPLRRIFTSADAPSGCRCRCIGPLVVRGAHELRA